MKNKQLTLEQYLGIVERLRVIINRGEPLQYYDCDEHGSKGSGCVWGRCIDEEYLKLALEVLPLKELHQFEDDFVKHNRISLLSTPDGFSCPMDKRNSIQDNSIIVDELGLKPNYGPDGKNSQGFNDPIMQYGCFYNCRIFGTAKKNQPNKAQALKLYDLEIIRVQEAIRNV